MSKLKNLLQYDAGTYIHLAIIVTCFLFARISYIPIILLGIQFFVLWKHSKRLLIYGFILCTLLSFRMTFSKTENVPSTIEGTVLDVTDESFTLLGTHKSTCYIHEGHTLVPGMIVRVKGYSLEIESRNIPGVFDYQTYVLSKKISSTYQVTSYQVLGRKQSLFTWKYRLINYINQTYDEKTASMLKLFVLGEKDQVYDAIEPSINEIGVSHLFAISGMHLAFLVFMIHALLKQLYISKESTRGIISIFLIAYNVLTGFKISILRASLLILGVYLKDTLKIKLTHTDILSFIMIGFLLYEPLQIYQSGFQLSFLITFCIILGNHLFKHTTKLKRMIGMIMLANVVSLPIVLSMNHHVSLFFILTNLIMIPLVSYGMLPGAILTLLIPVVAPFYTTMIDAFLHLIDGINHFNIFVEFSFPQSLYIVLFWLGIYGVIIFRNTSTKRNVAILGIIMVTFMSEAVPFKASVFVRFLDVGQGDAIHLHDGDFDAFIDTGSEDYYQSLTQYIDHFHIEEIDMIIITHFHEDHYGALQEILENVHVKTLYVSHESDLLNGHYQVLQAKDRFQSTHMSFEVLLANTGDDNENNNSIILLGNILGETYLFTGDAEIEMEEIILETMSFNVDVLKVPHHGSNTSSSLPFITSINPKIGIISVGKHNPYDLPNASVLHRYAMEHTEIYRTDEDGTITFLYYPIFHARIIECYSFQKRPRYLLDAI